MPRRPIDQPIGIERADEPLDERLHHLARKLPGVRPDDVAEWIDGNDRRPRPHGVAAPDPKLPIVNNRMQVLEPQRRLANPRRLTLGDELAAGDPDDRQLPRKPSFELPQLREYVNAIDSAVGPEVEEDDLSLPRIKGRRLTTRIDPVEPRRKLGRPDPRLRHLSFSHMRTVATPQRGSRISWMESYADADSGRTPTDCRTASPSASESVTS